MEVSKRINFIIENLDVVETLADIGTDHGYVPLLALEKGLCKKAIACDINKEPLDKAKLNAILEGIDDELDFRLGGGFEPLNVGEADQVVIAGMGGNLIRDILEEGKEKVKECSSIILVPAQNPEVLREYLYTNGYEVIKEDLCEDEGLYYEMFKVKKSEEAGVALDSIYYEVSPMLLRQKHPLMKEYLQYKIEDYNKILGFITESTVTANKRREDIKEKINIITSMLNYL